MTCEHCGPLRDKLREAHLDVSEARKERDEALRARDTFVTATRRAEAREERTKEHWKKKYELVSRRADHFEGRVEEVEGLAREWEQSAKEADRLACQDASKQERLEIVKFVRVWAERFAGDQTECALLQVAHEIEREEYRTGGVVREVIAAAAEKPELPPGYTVEEGVVRRDAEGVILTDENDPYESEETIWVAKVEKDGWGYPWAWSYETRDEAVKECWKHDRITTERKTSDQDELTELLWLLDNATGPTHHHSTDFDSECLACEWMRRFDAFKKKR